MGAGWLQGHDRWLLILDNVEDPADVEPLLGQLRGGHVVLTTRRDADWQRLAAPVRLDVLDPGPAAQIITARTGHTSGQDQADAAAIAAELGFLPLALDQAAAYIIQPRITPGRLPGQRSAEHPARMHAAARAAGAADDHPAVGPHHRRHPRPRPRRGPAAAGAGPLRARCDPPGHARRPTTPARTPMRQLGLLASYSMITLTADTISIHRLLQAVILALPQAPPTAPAPGHRAGLAGHGHPRRPRRQHGRMAAAARAGPACRGPRQPLPRRQQPCSSAGYRTRSRCSSSRRATTRKPCAPRNQRCGSTKAALGPDHPARSTALGNLALTYWDLGRAADALPLEQRALEITETALGPDHPDVPSGWATSPSPTATWAGPPTRCPWSSGRWPSPRQPWDPTTRDVPSGWATWPSPTAPWGGPPTRCPCSSGRCRSPRQPWDPTTRDVAIRLGNLAATYSELGRAADALPLEQRALQITEAALGPDHPRRGHPAGEPGHHLQRLGRAADALPLEQRALQITEAALGPDHPRRGHPAGEPGRHLPRPGAGRGRAAPAAAGAADHRDRPGTRPPATWPSRWGTWRAPTATWAGPRTRCPWSSGHCRSSRPDAYRPSSPATASG